MVLLKEVGSCGKGTKLMGNDVTFVLNIYAVQSGGWL